MPPSQAVEPHLLSEVFGGSDGVVSGFGEEENIFLLVILVLVILLLRVEYFVVGMQRAFFFLRRLVAV